MGNVSQAVIQERVETLNCTIDSLLAVRHLVALGMKPTYCILKTAQDALVSSLVVVKTI